MAIFLLLDKSIMDHGMEFKAKFQSVEIYFKCKQIILISMCTNLFQMQTNLYNIYVYKFISNAYKSKWSLCVQIYFKHIKSIYHIKRKRDKNLNTHNNINEPRHPQT